jgi:hypothetical protein
MQFCFFTRDTMCVTTGHKKLVTYYEVRVIASFLYPLKIVMTVQLSCIKYPDFTLKKKSSYKLETPVRLKM